MRPELIENPTFLRYYEKWQRDPKSIVFAAISEIFRSHNLLEDAIKIAQEGLNHHPNLISGRLALAKALLAKGETTLAHEQASLVLVLMPSNEDARKIISSGNKTSRRIETTIFDEEDDITEEAVLADMEDETVETSISEETPWQTMTMAGILESQGHFDRARRIYKAILERDPANEGARKALNK